MMLYRYGLPHLNMPILPYLTPFYVFKIWTCCVTYENLTELRPIDLVDLSVKPICSVNVPSSKSCSNIYVVEMFPSRFYSWSSTSFCFNDDSFRMMIFVLTNILNISPIYKSEDAELCCKTLCRSCWSIPF